MGFKGSLPLFSVSNSINLVTGRDASNHYGTNFVNSILKEKHPQIYSLIIPFRFPLTSKDSLCMDFFGIMKTISTIQCPFTLSVSNMAARGILQAEAGDQNLLEYVLSNSSSNSSYHRLIRQILWAKNNHQLALSGIRPSDYSMPEETQVSNAVVYLSLIQN